MKEITSEVNDSGIIIKELGRPYEYHSEMLYRGSYGHYEKTNPKKKFNYKIWIIIFSILDLICFILNLIFILAVKNKIFWLFFAFTLIFTIILEILIFLKMKRDKKDRELELPMELKKIEGKKKKKEELRLKKEEEKRIKKEKEEKIKKEEEAKLNEMKKKMFENQQKMREKKTGSELMTEQQKNKQINDVLEDMCIYGEVAKKEIKEEKEKHPEKFVETSQALKMENKDSRLFALGLLSSNLENLGIETAIEKDENPQEQNNDLTACNFYVVEWLVKNNMINISNLKKKGMKNY